VHVVSILCVVSNDTHAQEMGVWMSILVIFSLYSCLHSGHKLLTQAEYLLLAVLGNERLVFQRSSFLLQMRKASAYSCAISQQHSARPSIATCHTRCLNTNMHTLRNILIV